MLEKFKAILLREHQGHETGTIVEVMAGGDGFADQEGRDAWIVLRPVDLAGSWLVPLVDADRAISMKEAAHIVSFRRGPGWNTPVATVRQYIHKGMLAPAGRTYKGIGAPRRVWFASLKATWEMPLPKVREPAPRPEKQERPQRRVAVSPIDSWEDPVPALSVCRFVA